MSLAVPSDSAYARELEVSQTLAREAGALAMKYRDGELHIELKPGDEPVTIADRMSSDHIVRGLHEAFPDDVVISEENADDLRRLTAERVWYIDPIDGTKDFIRGREGFSVMIGLTVGHRPAAGVVFQPTGGRMFLGTNEGSWMTADGDTAPMHVSGTQEVTASRFVASRSHRSPKLDQVKGVLGITNELNIGSVGLKLALIASGERDLYVNPSSRCKSWDTCAPEVILAGAGGVLTDVHGDLLRYDQRDIDRPRGLVASNGSIHAQVIDRLRSVFPPDIAPED